MGRGTVWVESKLSLCEIRVCMLIVYSLAYAEMRVILARILWNFDFELCDESRGWMVNVKAFTLWEKEKLMMKIKIRGA